jgi:hypothetical protein
MFLPCMFNLRAKAKIHLLILTKSMKYKNHFVSIYACVLLKNTTHNL